MSSLDRSKIQRLDQQLCFPLYAASRLVTKIYQPYLAELDITYPQYLVLLCLWEKDKLSVTELTTNLLLESNTLTPLLKRLEMKNFIQRKRSTKDERSTLISLTRTGKKLKVKARSVPGRVVNCLQSEDVSMRDLQSLHKTLHTLLLKLS